MPNLLVIGYGNPLRRDDGLGPRLAIAIETLQLPQVRVISPDQLTPELADPIRQAEMVVFIDAAEGTAQVQVTKLTAADSSPRSGHTSDPAALLGLAEYLFGTAPAAWSITLPGSDFSFGEGLSAGAEQSLSPGMVAFRKIFNNGRRTPEGLKPLAGG